MDKLRIEVKKATAVGAKLAHIFLCIDPSTARQRFIATLFHSLAKPHPVWKSRMRRSEPWLDLIRKKVA